MFQPSLYPVRTVQNGLPMVRKYNLTQIEQPVESRSKQGTGLVHDSNFATHAWPSESRHGVPTASSHYYSHPQLDEMKLRCQKENWDRKASMRPPTMPGKKHNNLG